MSLPAFRPGTSHPHHANMLKPLLKAPPVYDMRQSLPWHLEGRGLGFLLVSRTCAKMDVLCAAAGLLESGVRLHEMQECGIGGTTYESNVLFPLRFMVDCKVRAGADLMCTVPWLCTVFSCVRMYVWLPRPVHIYLDISVPCAPLPAADMVESAVLLRIPICSNLYARSGFSKIRIVLVCAGCGWQLGGAACWALHDDHQSQGHT